MWNKLRRWPSKHWLAVAAYSLAGLNGWMWLAQRPNGWMW